MSLRMKQSGSKRTLKKVSRIKNYRKKSGHRTFAFNGNYDKYRCGKFLKEVA